MTMIECQELFISFLSCAYPRGVIWHLYISMSSDMPTTGIESVGKYVFVTEIVTLQLPMKDKPKEKRNPARKT